MKKSVLVVAATAAVVFASGMALADKGRDGQRERPDFATLDSNGDGGITLAELQAVPAARFAALDTDGDGAVSAAELAARSERATEERATQMIARHDTNEDGLLQLEEMQQHRGDRLARMFTRLDADSDGVVTQDEFAAAKGRRG